MVADQDVEGHVVAMVDYSAIEDLDHCSRRQDLAEGDLED